MMSQVKLHHVSVVTILDSFDPSSEMLISTWLTSTVLNSCTLKITQLYQITITHTYK